LNILISPYYIIGGIKMTRIVKCPDCQAEADEKELGKINIPIDAQVGDILECPDCGAEVEVISLNPPMVILMVEEK